MPDSPQVEPVGYYCDHSDEPANARTHHDWEWIDGEGLVFTHQPNTISAQLGLERYLGADRQERRCPRAQPVYSAALLNLVTADLAETRTKLEIAERQARDLDEQLAERDEQIAGLLHSEITDDEPAGVPW